MEGLIDTFNCLQTLATHGNNREKQQREGRQEKSDEKDKKKERNSQFENLKSSELQKETSDELLEDYPSAVLFVPSTKKVH